MFSKIKKIYSWESQRQILSCWFLHKCLKLRCVNKTPAATKQSWPLSLQTLTLLSLNTACLASTTIHISPPGLIHRAYVLLLCPFSVQNNLCWVLITCVDPNLDCKENNNPVSLCRTQDSCLSNHHISWLFSPWLRQGKKWYKCDRQGWWLSLMLSFHVVTLWLNSAGSSSINKVFRRSAICSTFPGLSEWLSLSVCSARSKWCLGGETPLEFLGECCQVYPRLLLKINPLKQKRITLVSFWMLCLWELESLLWKIGSGSFPCHDTVTFLWNVVYQHTWKQAGYISQNKHLAFALC